MATQQKSRIPILDPSTETGLRWWVRELDKKDLVYHFDDDPSEIYLIGSLNCGPRELLNINIFSPEECKQLTTELDKVPIGQRDILFDEAIDCTNERWEREDNERSK